MFGFLIGAVCGVAELFLLERVVRAVSAGDAVRIAALVLFKLLALVLAFAPVVIFFRDSLHLCGVGICAALISGAIIRMLVMKRKNRKEDAAQ